MTYVRHVFVPTERPNLWGRAALVWRIEESRGRQIRRSLLDVETGELLDDVVYVNGRVRSFSAESPEQAARRAERRRERAAEGLRAPGEGSRSPANPSTLKGRTDPPAAGERAAGRAAVDRSPEAGDDPHGSHARGPDAAARSRPAARGSCARIGTRPRRPSTARDLLGRVCARAS